MPPALRIAVTLKVAIISLAYMCRQTSALNAWLAIGVYIGGVEYIHFTPHFLERQVEAGMLLDPSGIAEGESCKNVEETAFFYHC